MRPDTSYIGHRDFVDAYTRTHDKVVQLHTPERGFAAEACRRVVVESFGPVTAGNCDPETVGTLDPETAGKNQTEDETAIVGDTVIVDETVTVELILVVQ